MKNIKKTLMRSVAVAGLSAFASAAALADMTVIHAGQLLDVPGTAPKSEQTVVIENGRITQVVAGYRDPSEFGEDAAAIDLKINL